MSLWILFVNWGTQPVHDFCWSNNWKWHVPDPMHGFRIFCQRGLWLFFAAYCLAQTQSNNCELPKVSKNKQVGSILICPKSAKWLSILNCSMSANERFEIQYITSHGEARNIKFEQQGKPHSKGSVGYPASEGTDIITP